MDQLTIRRKGDVYDVALNVPCAFTVRIGRLGGVEVISEDFAFRATDRIPSFAVASGYSRRTMVTVSFDQRPEMMPMSFYVVGGEPAAAMDFTAWGNFTITFRPGNQGRSVVTIKVTTAFPNLPADYALQPIGEYATWDEAVAKAKEMLESGSIQRTGVASLQEFVGRRWYSMIMQVPEATILQSTYPTTSRIHLFRYNINGMWGVVLVHLEEGDVMSEEPDRSAQNRQIPTIGVYSDWEEALAKVQELHAAGSVTLAAALSLGEFRKDLMGLMDAARFLADARSGRFEDKRAGAETIHLLGIGITGVVLVCLRKGEQL